MDKLRVNKLILRGLYYLVAYGNLHPADEALAEKLINLYEKKTNPLKEQN